MDLVSKLQIELHVIHVFLSKILKDAVSKHIKKLPSLTVVLYNILKIHVKYAVSDKTTSNLFSSLQSI